MGGERHDEEDPHRKVLNAPPGFVSNVVEHQDAEGREDGEPHDIAMRSRRWTEGRRQDGVVSHARPGFTAFTCGTCVSHNARRPSDLASTVQSLP